MASSVSVCVPVYNGRRFLIECFESILSQRDCSLDVIAVDDCSSDGSYELLQDLATKDDRVKVWQNQSRLGLVGNWNRCLELAGGEWIKFVFQDDILRPDCVVKLIGACRTHDRPFAFCRRNLQFGADTPEWLRASYLKHEQVLETIYAEKENFDATEFATVAAKFEGWNLIGEPTVTLFHQSLRHQFGSFEAALIQLCDAEYWNRLASNVGIVHVPERLATFRVHGQSATSENVTRRKFRMFYLDPLIIHYLVFRRPEYRRLRSALYRLSGRAVIWQRTCQAAYEARLFVEESRRDAPEDFTETVAEWRSVVSQFPGLSLAEHAGRYLELAGRLKQHITSAFRRESVTTSPDSDKRANYSRNGESAAKEKQSLSVGSAVRRPVEVRETGAGNGLRAIAFYLPQYYPIPENDEWWGVGFTEWTNVAKARPLFEGHYQPHVPADLGFYDLRVPETRSRQAALARAHGIHGFCYYHYWFEGRQLLERPFNEVLASGEPDFPFCFCWANENWTRVWDGRGEAVLQRQTYSERDDIEHIRALLPMFADRRYIKVEGRPVFLVYRLSELPDPAATIRRWRSEVVRAGFPGIYLANVESNFAAEHGLAARLPLDAAVEFAPDVQCLDARIQKWERRRLRLKKLPTEPWVSNSFFDYKQLRDKMLAKRTAEYLRFPCVTPMWDNTPRRRSGVTALTESTPDEYEVWLRNSIAKFVPPTGQENFVFINAWNEWGEGNHLEPCLRWGKAYLEATKRALAGVRPLPITGGGHAAKPVPSSSTGTVVAA